MTEILSSVEVFYQPSCSELADLICELNLCSGEGILTPIEKGHHNRVYKYETAEQTVVIRHPKTYDGVNELRAEFDLLLELNGRRSPKAITYADCNGTPVAVIEYINGTHRANFNQLNVEEISELARAMCDIHELTSSTYSKNSGEKPTHIGTRADYLQAMIQESVVDRMQTLWVSKGDLSEYNEAQRVIDTGLRKLDEIISNHPDDFSSTTFSLLHHDLNPDNVIWGSDGVVTFIDANPTYGDPLDDVNYAITNNQGSPEFQRALMTAYEELTGETISDAQMDAYTLKNWLDDLAWTIMMCEQYRDDPTQHHEYLAAYESRLTSLQQLLQAPGIASNSTN